MVKIFFKILLLSLFFSIQIKCNDRKRICESIPFQNYQNKLIMNYCYNSNFERLYQNDNQLKCIFSYCIESIIPQTQHGDVPKNIPQALDKLKTGSCRNNENCFSCCNQGVCQVKEYCDQE